MLASLASSAALEALKTLAKRFGLDVRAEELSREKLELQFAKVVPHVVKRLEKDGVTPSQLSDTDDEKRQLIRSAEYLLWKGVVKSITGKEEASNFAADFIRDRHDDQVVPVVAPQISAAMTTEALVMAVAAAEVAQTT